MTEETHHAAVAAIQFALSNPEGMEFLRLWNEGEFDILRRDWPEAPDSVYIGAESTPEDLQPSKDKPIPEAVAEKIEAVLYQVYMNHPDSRLTTTMIRDMAAAVVQSLAQQPAMDGCHCRTCTCNPNMTPAVRFDLSPAQKEGVVREHLIRLGWTPPKEAK